VSRPLAKQQGAFTAAIRSPDEKAMPPGLDAQRFGVYRDLVYRNLEGLLAGGFPVIKATLAPEHWEALLRQFLQHHRARTPLFLELGREFVDFLETRRQEGWEPGWLLELADYERVELELSIALDLPQPASSPPFATLAEAVPVLSPLARLLCYSYPVHCIGPDRDPAPSPTFLLVYRDAAEEVQFMELTPATAHLLARVEHNEAGATSLGLAQDLADTLGLPRESVQTHALAQLEDFAQRGVVIFAAA